MPVTLLSIQEATQRYRLPPSVLQSLIRDGRIRTVRLADQELVPDEDLALVAGQPQGDNGDRWVALAQAIALHPDLDADLLRKLVKDGVIASKTPPDSTDVLVDRYEFEEVARKLDRGQWRHLEGTGISINAAARKYGLRSPSLWKWARDGYIRILRNDGYRTWLDEADVGFARALSDLAGKPGRALFPRR